MTDHEKVLAAFGALGFDEWQTGGGCTAFGQRLFERGEEIGYILVTQSDGDGAPTSMSDSFAVGFYTPDGEETDDYRADMTAEQAIDYVRWLDANARVAL